MAIINGTPGNDVLVGTADNDEINGLAGDDRLEGLAGDDRLIGGPGNDVLHESFFDNNDDFLRGGAGDDTLEASGGDDTLIGDAGNDFLIGDGVNTQVGNDTIVGGAGDDVLLGGEANDRLFGGAGNDVVVGGSGVDENRGGDGADTFFFDDIPLANDGVVYDTGVGAGNRDRIIDFDGTEGDKMDVSRIDADVTIGGAQQFTFVGGEPVGKGEIGFVETGNLTIVRGNSDNDAAPEFEIQLNGIGHDLSADDFILLP